jgi:hypothetical protein
MISVGSGSGPCSFSSVTIKMQKNFFVSTFLGVLLLEGAFTSFFTDKKWRWEDPDPYLWPTVRESQRGTDPEHCYDHFKSMSPTCWTVVCKQRRIIWQLKIYGTWFHNNNLQSVKVVLILRTTEKNGMGG